MFYYILLTLLVMLFANVPVASAQDSSARAQDLAAQLDKTKYKKKDKGNVHIELYVDVKNSPVLRKNAAEYSGTYSCDDDSYELELKAAADGSAIASGHDMRSFNGKRSKFTLRDARIDGSVLTGTKVFDDGTTEPFEAVFVDQNVRTGKNAESVLTSDLAFGLAFIQKGDEWTSRVFLKKEN